MSIMDRDGWVAVQQMTRLVRSNSFLFATFLTVVQAVRQFAH